MTLDKLVSEYEQYARMPEFVEGWRDYGRGRMQDLYTGVAQQAYDRGAEAAMRWQRLKLG